MSITITIGGEDRTLQDFMAYKAITAMRLVADVEEAFRDVLHAGAEFKRQYEAEHYVEIPRAEARRQMRPRPLSVQIERPLEGGGSELRDEPVLDEHGQPVLGPDPLGHLSEADWQQSGHVLRIPDTPSEEMSMLAMIPTGFRLARTHVLRLLALALTANADLEKWDVEGENVDAKLDGAAAALLHRASMAELIRAAIATMEVCREQVADPFAEAKAAWAAWRPTVDEPAAPAPQPAVFESLPNEQPTSSISSPASTDGTPGPVSTAPAGASS